MSTAAPSYEQLLESSMNLPLQDRSRLATRLIESLDDADDDIEISQEWREELNRRVESVRLGTAQLVPHEEVMAQVRRKLAEQRAAKFA